MKNSILNERELIKNAVKYLEQYGDASASTNNSRFPSLIIGMGENLDEIISEIRTSLDYNWSNAMHLEFLNVLYQGGNDWKCRRYRSQEEYDEIVDNGNTDVDRNEWLEDCKSFMDEAVEAEYRMLGKRASFSNPGQIKMDFILDATDEHAVDYYKLFKSFKLSSGHMQYKTLYVMLCQMNIDNKLEKSEKMLQTILHDKELEGTCVYLISDEYSDGSHASGDEIRTNYRLIADLIFLSGDRENESAGLPVLNNGVKLVSYTIFQKLTGQIAEVSVGDLLYRIYSAEEKRFSTVSMDLEEFCKRIGLKQGRFEIAEKQWQDFERRLPGPEKNPLPYFPYADKNGLADARKEFKRNVRGAFAILERATYGVSEAYLADVYSDCIGSYFRENDLYNKIYGFVKNRFNYFELLSMKPLLRDIEDAIMLDIPNGLHADSLDDAFRARGEYMAKVSYYKEMKEAFWTVIKGLVEDAEKFRLNYLSVRNQLDVARSINGEEEESIETYYGKVVDDYILKVQNSSPEIAFRNFFDVRLDRVGMLNQVFVVYEDLIKDRSDIYNADFETEMTKRMDNLTPVQVTMHINNYFSGNMENNIRLHNTRDIRPLIESLSNYYMLNMKAEYYNTLKSAEDFKNGIYKLISLRRSDCIIQLSIYGIRKPDEISIAPDGMFTGQLEDRIQPELDTWTDNSEPVQTEAAPAVDPWETKAYSEPVQTEANPWETKADPEPVQPEVNPWETKVDLEQVQPEPITEVNPWETKANPEPVQPEPITEVNPWETKADPEPVQTEVNPWETKADLEPVQTEEVSEANPWETKTDSEPVKVTEKPAFDSWMINSNYSSAQREPDKTPWTTNDQPTQPVEEPVQSDPWTINNQPTQPVEEPVQSDPWTINNQPAQPVEEPVQSDPWTINNQPAQPVEEPMQSDPWTINNQPVQAVEQPVQMDPWTISSQPIQPEQPAQTDPWTINNQSAQAVSEPVQMDPWTINSQPIQPEQPVQSDPWTINGQPIQPEQPAQLDPWTINSQPIQPEQPVQSDPWTINNQPTQPVSEPVQSDPWTINSQSDPWTINNQPAQPVQPAQSEGSADDGGSAEGQQPGTGSTDPMKALQDAYDAL